MASPLTMYVQIKQDPQSQQTAKKGVEQFNEQVGNAFDTNQLVHYATFTLVPNPSTEPGRPSRGNLGILLLTDFDGAMNPYLEAFWNNGLSDIFNTLASIAYNPTPVIETLAQFENFINGNNLTPLPENGEWTNFYEAYSLTVKQIHALSS